MAKPNLRDEALEARPIKGRCARAAHFADCEQPFHAMVSAHFI
jgi:hypothetical protein